MVSDMASSDDPFLWVGNKLMSAVGDVEFESLDVGDMEEAWGMLRLGSEGLGILRIKVGCASSDDICRTVLTL